MAVLVTLWFITVAKSQLWNYFVIVDHHNTKTYIHFFTILGWLRATVKKTVLLNEQPSKHAQRKRSSFKIRGPNFRSNWFICCFLWYSQCSDEWWSQEISVDVFVLPIKILRQGWCHKWLSCCPVSFLGSTSCVSHHLQWEKNEHSHKPWDRCF